jgi:hypothetical protein
MHEMVISKLKVIKDFSLNFATIDYNGQLFKYSTDETDRYYLDLYHPLFNHLSIKKDGNNEELYELRTSGDLFLLYGISLEERFYPIVSIEEFLDYIICGKSLKISATRCFLDKKSLATDLWDILSANTSEFINPKQVRFFNYSFRDFDNLKLVKTNIKVSCNFD